MSSADASRQRGAAVPAHYIEGGDATDDDDNDDSAPLASLVQRTHHRPRLSPLPTARLDEDVEPAGEEEEEEVKEVRPVLRRAARRAGDDAKASTSSASSEWAFRTRADGAAEEDDDEAEYGEDSEEVRRARVESTSPLLTSRSLRNRSTVNYTKTRIVKDPHGRPRPRAAGGRGKEVWETLPRGPPPSKRRKVQEEEEFMEVEEERKEGKAEKIDWNQERHRRSGRTSGKLVDYTSRELDELIRNVSRPAAPNPTTKKSVSDKARRAQWEDVEDGEQEGQEGEEEEDAVENEQMADEEAPAEEEEEEQEKREERKNPPLTDSEDEGWYGPTVKPADAEEARWQFEADQWADWDITRILGVRYVTETDPAAPDLPPPPIAGAEASASSSSAGRPRQRTEYYVRWKGRGYRHCTWLDVRTILRMPGFHLKAMITRFHKKHPNAGASSPPTVEQAEDGSLVQLEEGQYFNPDYLQVDRIISRRKVKGADGDEYLVKWKGLGYDETTWETAKDIDNDAEIARYFHYSQPPPEVGQEQRRGPVIRSSAGVTAQVKQLKFKGDRQLRDYQIEGVSWLAFNYIRGRPCLLADEMGLGKTAQTIGLCVYLQRYCGIRGPFLIVVPLSTASHWQREFDSWTDFNTLIYHGTQEARDIIEHHEFQAFERNGKIQRSRSAYRFNALIVPDSMIKSTQKSGDAIRALRSIDWKLLVCDEGHRLKNTQSELAQTLSSFNAVTRIILTGTPIQNNLGELWSVLHFLDPSTFSSETSFLAEYGDVAAGSTDHLDLLQKRMQPYFLRRIKEDVEKNIPPRQETLIEVDLSRPQKVHYKALYQKDLSLLMRGSKGDLPSLENLGMQLRKCSNHPWLLKGVEDTAVRAAGLSHARDSDHPAILELMVNSSGKFILLRKMLQKLRSEGHRVLVFSQMTRALDLIEDAVRLWQLKYERIDGGVTGNARQAAIDRFCKEGSDRFLFLLSTKAGGLGLNLQVADTIIIFDSDWNPQNDLQAIARSHRIGQTKEVQVYRLIARNTYENEMFNRASRKLGLGHAIMGSMTATIVSEGSDSRAPRDREEIALMLRKGFYYQADETKESTQLTEDTFDKIMERDAKVIEYRVGGGNPEAEGASSAPAAGSNRFAKASFVTEAGKEEGEWNDEDFWQKMFPQQAHARDAGDGFIDDNILVGKRKRKMLHGTYDELLNDPVQRHRKAIRESLEATGATDGEYVQLKGDSDSNSSEDEDDVKEQQKQQPHDESRGPLLQRPSPFPAGHPELLSVFMGSFLRFGYGRWARIRADMDDVAQGRIQSCAEQERKPSLEALLACVRALTDDDLMYYSVGWLKMLYIYRQYDVLFDRSKGDSDSDGGGKAKKQGSKGREQRMRKVGRRGGNVPGDSVDFVYSTQLAADARTVILWQQRSIRDKEKREKQRLQQVERQRQEEEQRLRPALTALAAVDALSAEADALINRGAQSSTESSFQPADEVVTADFSQEGEEEVTEAELKDLHFLDLIERIPVHHSLISKQKEMEFKSAIVHIALWTVGRGRGQGYLRLLQLCYVLQLVVEEVDGEVRCTSDAEEFRAAEFSPQFKSGRSIYLDEHLGQWWRMPEDDCELLKGMWIHGIDRLQLLQLSPHLTFHSRIGQTAELKKLNPAFAKRRDEVISAQETGQKALEAANAAFRATPQYVMRVVRVTWPDEKELEAYSRKLISALKLHLRAQQKKAVKQAADEQRRRVRQLKMDEAARAVKRELEEKKKVEETKAAKRRADDAVRQMSEQRVRDAQVESPPLSSTSTSALLPPLTSKSLSGMRPKLAVLHQPLPMLPLPSHHYNTTSPHKLSQASITNFYHTKPKLPLIETSAAQVRPRVSYPTPSSTSSTSSHGTPSSSSSSSSHSLPSSSPFRTSAPHPFLSLLAPSHSRKPTQPPVAGWPMELPSSSPSSSHSRRPGRGRKDEQDEEGDIDEEEDDSSAPPKLGLLPRPNARQRVNAARPATPRAAPMDDDEDDIIVLLSDDEL